MGRLRQGRGRRTPLFFAAWLIGLALHAVPAAAADQVVNLRITGPAANRIDIVVLGDGYRAAELAKFATDANTFVAAFFAQVPFNSYRNDFNVRRIDTPSAVSGAGYGTGLNTVYGAYFNCFNIDRLLCVDETKVAAVLARDLPPLAHDVVIVLVNDPRYGGSGGAYAVASTHPLAKEIALHELGHSFGHLDDEYSDGNCDQTDAWGYNVTRRTARATIPWTRWIPATTPVPTQNDNGVGLYQGAFYCVTGWYRPTFDSKMRTLGVPFKQVNGEQLIRRIYFFVNSIDAVAPTAATVKVLPGGKQIFTVTPVDKTSTTLRFGWRLGGVLISTTKTATVSYADVATAKTLQLTVMDATAQVRYDPLNYRIDRHNWRVTR